jgi:hypothetical protein
MTIAISPAITYNTFEPILVWQEAAFESLAQAQNIQLQWLSEWQRLFPGTRELWDQWIAHFGGGVPLDG